MKKCFIVFLVLLPLLLGASPGDWRAVGGSEWGMTIAGTVMNGALYTAESSGYLYVTDLTTGNWRELNTGFENTRFMFNDGNWLYTIETDGSLYRISPMDGSWQQIGTSGDWVMTVAGTVLDGKLYTAESSGFLYETNLATGQWREIAGGYANTKYMFAANGKLYTIENDGSMYEIQPSNGSWKQIGSPGAWSATIAGAMLDGTLYTAESTGYFYSTNPRTGQWKEIASGYANTRFMFAGNGMIYTIETDGTLYEIQVR